MANQAKVNAEEARDRIQKRLQEIEAEARGLREQLINVNAFLETFSAFESLQPNDPIPSTVMAAKGSTPSHARPSNPPREKVADAALKAITEAGRPMQRAELFEAVTKQGLVIEGKDPQVVFSTMLWREQGRIAKLPKLGYWDAHKPYEPAGYDP